MHSAAIINRSLPLTARNGLKPFWLYQCFVPVRHRWLLSSNAIVGRRNLSYFILHHCRSSNSNPSPVWMVHQLCHPFTTRPTSSSGLLLRWIHATPIHHLAVSRRRKRDPVGILERKAPVGRTTNDESGADGTQDIVREKVHDAFMTTEEFREQSSHLISRIHAALVSLGSINPNMVLSRGRHELDDNEQHQKLEQHGAQVDPPANQHDNEPDNDQTQTQAHLANKNEKHVDQPVYPSVGDYLWIDLGPVHGQYTIQADEAMQIIILLSPISGQRVYRYDNHQSHVESRAEDPNRWMCTDDGHILEGLLVRDLIRQIQGVPNL